MKKVNGQILSSSVEKSLLAEKKKRGVRRQGQKARVKEVKTVTCREGGTVLLARKGQDAYQDGARGRGSGSTHRNV